MQLSQQKISPEVLRSCCGSGAVSLSCLRTQLESLLRGKHTQTILILSVRVSTTKDEMYSVAVSPTDQELHGTLCHTLQSKGHVKLV